jgi:hypothetical protein
LQPAADGAEFVGANVVAVSQYRDEENHQHRGRPPEPAVKTFNIVINCWSKVNPKLVIKPNKCMLPCKRGAKSVNPLDQRSTISAPVSRMSPNSQV